MFFTSIITLVELCLLSKYFPKTIYNEDTQLAYIDVWYEDPNNVYMHCRIGMDKIAHFGIGGIIGAAIAIVITLARGDYGCVVGVYPFVAHVIVFILSFVKEKFLDDEFNWLDILASLLGSIAMHIAFILGLTINELVK